MKTIIKIFVLLPFIFQLTSCSNTESPTEPISLSTGEYIGTFSVTFKNYQNYYSNFTQEGEISIMFSDSIYDYSAKVDYSSNNTSGTILIAQGKYSKSEEKIIMNDESWMRMDARWHNSLYLVDTFAIQSFGNQIEITQENSFAIWKLSISPKSN